MRNCTLNSRPAFLCAASLLLAGTLTGCGGNSTYDPAVIGSGPPPAASFTLSVTPPIQTVAPGDTAIYTVTLTPINGFNQSVNLSISGLPPHTVASFSSFTGTSTSNNSISTLTILTNADHQTSRAGTTSSNRKAISAAAPTRATTPDGASLFTVTGTSGGLTRQATATLNVQSSSINTPEPGTVALFGALAFAGIGFLKRRRR